MNAKDFLKEIAHAVSHYPEAEVLIEAYLGGKPVTNGIYRVIEKESRITILGDGTRKNSK